MLHNVGWCKFFKFFQNNIELLVVAQIAVAPTYLVSYGFDTIWVTSSKTISRIDPATNTVVAEIAVDDETFVDLWGEPVEFTADAAFVVADRNVFRIDPATNQLVATVPVGFVPYNFTTDAETVWLRGDSAAAAGFVARFDPATNTLTHYTKISGQGDIIVAPDGDLWITSGRPDGLVERVHPTF
jgi:streptogramin lyase